MNCMQITMENENNKHLGDTEQFVNHLHNNHLRRKRKTFFFGNAKLKCVVYENINIPACIH